MKLPVIIIFILIFALVFWALNYYIGLRVWQYTGIFIPGLNKKIYWVAFWILAFTYAFARLCAKYLPDVVRKYTTITGGYWMAAMLYFILLLVIFDLLRLIARWTGLNKQFTMITNLSPLVFGATILAIVVATLIYGTWNANSTRINTYDPVTIHKRTGSLDRLHIVMASDVHLGIIIDRARLAGFVEKVNSLNPDIVLLPGDILDDDVETFEKQKMWEILSQLKTRYGVFASLGNHEYIGSGGGDAAALLEKSGVKVLQDEVVLVNGSFYVAGRNDPSVTRYTGKPRKPLAEILKGVDKNLPIFLLDHQPIKLEEAQNNGVDLQVSGHTHRGQMYPNQFITKRTFELDWGYLQKGNTHYIVSSGYGTWGPPIRVGNGSELVEIKVEFKGVNK